MKVSKNIIYKDVVIPSPPLGEDLGGAFPKLTLVGAGPGDPELITLKGIIALQEADVVLYDALIDVSLLEFSEKAIKIFVGKRGGEEYLSQDEINKLIVQMAFSYGHVVRLKGGDSFVFGRGHEEMEYAQSFNIPVNIVPGITSAIAVPELQHIPVTKRGVSESVWILTGSTKNGDLSTDIAIALQSSATLVILMGVKHLPEIVCLFQAQGKGTVSVAVIQNGSQKNEKIALGSMDEILLEVKKQKITSPAVIVIGDVVKSHPILVAEYAALAQK